MTKEVKRNPKPLQSKSRTHDVTHLSDNRYSVTSGTSNEVYTVRVWSTGATCTCKWAQYRSGGASSGCSHTIAVFNFIEQQRGRVVSAWSDKEQAEKQHRPMANIQDGIFLTSRKVA